MQGMNPDIPIFLPWRFAPLHAAANMGATGQPGGGGSGGRLRILAEAPWLPASRMQLPASMPTSPFRAASTPMPAGHYDCCESLLDGGATPGLGDGMAWTALHWSAAMGQLAVTRLLLRRAPELVTARTATGQVALKRLVASSALLPGASLTNINSRCKVCWAVLYRARLPQRG